jgi:hypothetical protein
VIRGQEQPHAKGLEPCRQFKDAARPGRMRHRPEDPQGHNTRPRQPNPRLSGEAGGTGQSRDWAVLESKAIVPGTTSDTRGTLSGYQRFPVAGSRMSLCVCSPE